MKMIAKFVLPSAIALPLLLAVSGCISSSSPPAPQHTTVIVPPPASCSPGYC